MATRLSNGFCHCLLYFLSTNLHNSYAQYYYASQSDSFNIAIILGSALIALILVVLAFYFLYYCWIKGLLAEYREEQQRIFELQQQQQGNNGGHYYKKRPALEAQPAYGSGAFRQQELGGPARFDVRRSPQRIVEDVDNGAPYRPTSAAATGAQIYLGSPPAHDLSYDRSITMRAGSPAQMAASNLAANELAAADSSFESRRRYSPAVEGPNGGGGNLRTTTTAAHYVRSNTMPGGEPSVGGSRPASGLSARSRAFEIAGVDYRPDAALGGLERQPAFDAGNGGALSYQATFQQKVTSTSTRNRAAYLGSAV